ncbi:hypothetical protein [Magnetospirillum sp. UT-4]|uniref:hypothetical protein n=1 Tax=Magnetospirillum sp. UT-4 TaxID=2681467 RepID=UPI00157168AF|nr:hypothetical protein [Magnetospirillum sp. UT-4]
MIGEELGEQEIFNAHGATLSPGCWTIHRDGFWAQFTAMTPCSVWGPFPDLLTKLQGGFASPAVLDGNHHTPTGKIRRRGAQY